MNYDTESKKMIKDYAKKNEDILNSIELKGYDGELAEKMQNLHEEFIKDVKDLRQKYNLL